MEERREFYAVGVSIRNDQQPKTDECEKHADWRKRMIVMCTGRNIRTKKFCKT